MTKINKTLTLTKILSQGTHPNGFEVLIAQIALSVDVNNPDAESIGTFAGTQNVLIIDTDPIELSEGQQIPIEYFRAHACLLQTLTTQL